ncbi:MAG: T9SS type A sorting domain-containing protein [Crocinitomicaceae bacterium]
MYYRFLLPLFLIFISFTAFSQQLEKMILEDWKDGAWVNRMQELPFYDEEGRLIKKEIAHWNPSLTAWEERTKTEFERAEDGVLVSKETYKWDTELSNWFPSLKASYTVNTQNRPTYVLTETHDGDGWENQSVDEFEYDTKGRLKKKQLSRWNTSTQSWAVYRKYEYQMESDRKTGYTIYFWDNKVAEWQLYKRAVYQYDSNESVEYIEFDTWIDGKWKKHSIRKNVLDDEGALSAIDVDIFDHESEVWEESTHVDYELTDFGKLSTSTSKKRQSEGWKNLQRSTYYYSEDGAMISEWRTAIEMELFPNPALERLTIRSLPIGKLTVLDALGKVVLQSENTDQEMQLDISGWEMGTYSVLVDGNEVRQFVKQ